MGINKGEIECMRSGETRNVNRKYKDNTSLILFVTVLAMQTYFFDDKKFFSKHTPFLILSK
jgi:hypothetical protein